MRYVVGWHPASGWHTTTYIASTDALGRVLELWCDTTVDHDSVASWQEEIVPAW